MYSSTTIADGIGYLPLRLLAWGLGWESAEKLSCLLKGNASRVVAVPTAEWKSVHECGVSKALGFSFVSKAARSTFTPAATMRAAHGKAVRSKSCCKTTHGSPASRSDSRGPGLARAAAGRAIAKAGSSGAAHKAVIGGGEPKAVG